ncbi:MAG: aminomethyltransferase family protein [Pseudomonadota bacterium]
MTAPAAEPIRNVVTSHNEPGWNYGYQNSPYFAFDHARGASFVVYNRRLMPIAFDDDDRFEDYWALRRAATMLPTGELPLEIKGPDAERLCDMVFTKDITKLKPGRCAYGIACYPDGGLIVDGILMRLEADRFWYVQADGDIHSWFIAHAQGLDVEVRDPNVWVNQVQGPLALDVLAKAADNGLPDPFGYFAIADITIGGQRVIVTRTGWTGEVGWEYYSFPETDCHKLWRDIMRAGESAGMVHIGLDSMDIRRIEAAILNAGSDFDHTMNPFQAGLGPMVDLKKADFFGKAALLEADQRPLLYGVRCADAEPLTSGPVAKSGKAVGHLSAAAWSPFLSCGIGYVRLDDTEHGPGDAIEVVGVDGKTYAAEIVELPYYDKEKRIPRGLDKEIPARA